MVVSDAVACGDIDGASIVNGSGRIGFHNTRLDLNTEKTCPT